jgi:hypothetical protein
MFVGRGLPAFLLPLACLGLAGCTPPDHGVVTGTVTLDGKPVVGAYVVFTLESQPAHKAMGATGEGGRYRVVRPGGRPGAFLGANSVTVAGGGGETSEGQSAPVAIPARYNRDSELRCDVKPGPNVYDIEMRSGG